MTLPRYKKSLIKHAVSILFIAILGFAILFYFSNNTTSSTAVGSTTGAIALERKTALENDTVREQHNMSKSEVSSQLPAVQGNLISPEYRRSVQNKYRCGTLSRLLRMNKEDRHPNMERVNDLEKRLAEDCTGLNLSTASIYDDLFSLASAGDLGAIHQFATAPPLADPDRKTERELEIKFANDLPLLLSKGVAMGDVTSMRLSAEYFISCNIRIAGVSLFSLNPNYHTDGPASLAYLQRARELSGPDKNSRYEKLEILLDQARRSAGLTSTCPGPDA